jgi:hypothetical protein
MPVLKVKRGEKRALQDVAPSLRSQIVPLMEIVERNHEKSPSIEKHLETAFQDFATVIRSYGRFLLDSREIARDGPRAAAAVYERAAEVGMAFTPVTGVSRSADVAPALAHRTHGLALRLTRPEFEAGDLTKRIETFLTRHGVSASEIDLVTDLGSVDGLVAEGVANLTEEFLAVIPTLGAWRTLTVAGSAFPRSMGAVERHSHKIVERAEWTAWRDALYTRRANLERLPTFGDCAIQHPLGVEGFDPRTMQVSAAVRYALPDDWLLLKGQGTRVVAPSLQFPRLAQRLARGDLRSYFAGEAHCVGCAGIGAAAAGAGGFGSAEAWRRLGTIHHITTATERVTGLPWP